MVAATCRSAGAIGERRRHTSAIVRCGAGSANGRTLRRERPASCNWKPGEATLHPA